MLFARRYGTTKRKIKPMKQDLKTGNGVQDMVVIRFGTWCRETTMRYVYTRIYINGYKWTPFCKREKRYIKKEV